MKDEALRLALEALEYNDHLRGEAITAIKQALEQPEPEPVAWTDIDFTNIYISKLVAKEKNANVPLYTSEPKREWQGLTDEEIIECDRVAGIRHTRHRNSVRGQQISSADNFWWHFAHTVEAKLKEKNT